MRTTILAAIALVAITGTVSAAADTNAMQQVLANLGIAATVTYGGPVGQWTSVSNGEYTYTITAANIQAGANGVAGVLGMAASQANIDQYSSANIIVKIIGGSTYGVHVNHDTLIADYVAIQAGDTASMNSIYMTVVNTMAVLGGTRANTGMTPDWNNYMSKGPVGGDWL
jgi:hypothetical protein